MAFRKVMALGHPILRKIATPVPEDKVQSIEIQNLIKDMIETMIEYDGRGLAAPQIHESVQIIVMLWDFEPEKDSKIVCLINPELQFLTEDTQSFWEGCLSLSGLRGKVTRRNKLRVKAFNEKGTKVETTFEGLGATVVQHEYDHLIGKLFIDRMDDFEYLAFNREYQKFHALE